MAGKLHIEYVSWMDSRLLHDPDELAAKLNDLGASVLVVELDFVFQEVFEAVPSLKFVGICRAATSHVDIEAATANGVVVVNTPGRNAQAVAEHALGLMLAWRGASRRDTGTLRAGDGSIPSSLTWSCGEWNLRAGRLASWDSAPSDDGWLRWRGRSAWSASRSILTQSIHHRGSV